MASLKKKESSVLCIFLCSYYLPNVAVLYALLKIFWIMSVPTDVLYQVTHQTWFCVTDTDYIGGDEDIVPSDANTPVLYCTSMVVFIF